MLIIRDDNVINMCELKFYSGEYDVDNKYYKTLMDRESLLQKEVPKYLNNNLWIKEKRIQQRVLKCHFDG